MKQYCYKCMCDLEVLLLLSVFLMGVIVYFGIGKLLNMFFLKVLFDIPDLEVSHMFLLKISMDRIWEHGSVEGTVRSMGFLD